MVCRVPPGRLRTYEPKAGASRQPSCRTYASSTLPQCRPHCRRVYHGRGTRVVLEDVAVESRERVCIGQTIEAGVENETSRSINLPCYLVAEL
jgi:hypothetical protein